MKKIIFGILFSLFFIAKIAAQKTSDGESGLYKKNWEQVDAFSKKGLYRSAIEQINNIYKKAAAEKNSSETVKAILVRITFQNKVDESSNEKSIYEIQKEIKTSTFPTRNLLHSILAELYWNYYQENRWNINNRTATVHFNNDSINTWDIRKIVDATLKNYQASLRNSDSLKLKNLNDYETILSDGNARELRPTLYDFLAHRALDFYKNEELEITHPAYQFALNDAAYLRNFTDFSKIKIITKDTFSLKYEALKLFQKIILFHSKNTSPKEISALLDVDLERLQFVYQHAASLENKDSLYVRALRQLEKIFFQNPSSTEVACDLASFYSDHSEIKNEKNNATRWNKQKAMTLCEAAIKRFPDSFGAANCKSLENIIRAKNISFQIPEINAPEKPFPALVSYSNVKKIFFRIVTKAQNKSEKNNYSYLDEKAISMYAKQNPIKAWSVDLPLESDFQKHSVEIKIPELDFGEYIILMSADENFSCNNNGVAYNACTISNISYIQRKQKDSGSEYYLLDRTSGNPLKNVSVQLFQSKYDYNKRTYKTTKIANYVSDEEGHFSVPAYAGAYDEMFSLDFTLGKDELKTGTFYNESYHYNYGGQRDSVTKTYFFTDRKIYRPGQIIYFKGILLAKNGTKNKLLPNKKTTVTFFDVNRQVVSSLNLTSNEYASVNGSFVAPNALNGEMRIANEDGEISFSVEDYKRPKFEVAFNPVKNNYKLGDTISVSGTAKAYSGNAIDGSQVKYRVVRNASYPCWYWDYVSTNSETEIANGTILSNDTGGFVIPFKALPDLAFAPNTDPTFMYTVYADVTDVSGETHSSQTVVVVGYTSVDLNITMPEEINKQKTDTFYIRVNNKSGELQTANVSVKIFKLQAPNRSLRNRLWSAPDTVLYSQQKWDSIFPDDEYLNENDKHFWQKTATVLDKEFDTRQKNNFSTGDFKNWQQGSYLLEAHTIDKSGKDVKEQIYFTLFDSKEKNLVVQKPDVFTVLKNSCEPGEKASFLIGSTDENVNVLFEIERKNKISKHEWIQLNREQKIIEIPVEEADRGGFSVHFVFVKNNREYIHNAEIYVSHKDKNLDLKFETFRDKMLPGAKEEWKIKIRGSKGEKVAAEMMVTMYDASLDAFSANNWNFDIYNYYYSSLNWDAENKFSAQNSSLCENNWNKYTDGKYHSYDALASFYLGGSNRRRFRTVSCPSFGGDNFSNALVGYTSPMLAMKKASSKNEDQAVTALEQNSSISQESTAATGKDNRTQDLSNITARTNFNETAFFYPQLATDDSGNVVINFTLPEAETRWKIMGLAYSKDLQIGQIEKELVTQKKLMITANAPRFFREGDTIQFSAKVSDLSDSALSGTAQLILYDAISMKDITDLILGGGKNTDYKYSAQQNFAVKKGQSTAFSWQLIIPKGMDAVTYKVVAIAGNYSDGEQNTVPVLRNSMLVTESLPLPIRGQQTKSFSFEKLISQNNHSATLVNHSLTLEFTANPAWCAIQALPYMMEYPYECAEQTFDRFYANDIASYIVHSSPKIKAVFDAWKNQSPETFFSNLQKNQELKSLMLEETPWVMDAKNETEQKRRVALLFDLNKMSNEMNQAIQKLKKMQTSNGGWAWFSGMEDDRYITQYIISGMGHLDRLGITNVRKDASVWQMVQNGIPYLDDRINEDYQWIQKYDAKHINENHLSNEAIQYLYARSFFKDIPMNKKNEMAFLYFKNQSKCFWLGQSNYMQGMIALILNRYDDKEKSQEILKSLKENAINSEEIGMYWKNDYSGMYWYQSPIEEHALLIEAFQEVNKDEKTVDDLKIWLLKNKQTENWKTTKATAEACYALLLQGTDWLKTDPQIEIKTGSEKIFLADKKNNTEAGTGYFKKVWQDSAVKPELGKIEITKTDSGISWGAMYWQYFEQLDKITMQATPLNINKKLFLEKNSDAGIVLEPITEKTNLHVGDKVKVRIELRVDRNMDYVQMKDMRAACFEPLNVLSGYKYQDGLGYYESTRDAATNFFFDHIYKGTYVFEYPLVITHDGNFSNGITTIQCMYAPEFTSHSEGVRVKVKN